MNIIERLNTRQDKITFYYDLGRGPGQRPSTGLFIYTHPKNQAEKNHNREALALLEIKKGQHIIEHQAVGTNYIPSHKLKPNFLDYYQEFVDNNKRGANRHLICCLSQFKKFYPKTFLSASSITYDFCFRFRRYLLDRLTGESPQNYYATFKLVIKNATKEGYFKVNPTEDIAAIRKPSKELKEILEVEDYLALLQYPVPTRTQKIMNAFIFSCYTGLRWCDVYVFRWKDIKDGVMTTRIIQAKTGQPITLTLHPIAMEILKKQKQLPGVFYHPEGRVFHLPT